MPSWTQIAEPGGPDPDAVSEAKLRSALGRAEDTIDLLYESIADLERATDEPGWRRIIAQKNNEFSEDSLKRIATMCQLMAVKNPLIKRALDLRAAYTWGQGVEIIGVDSRVDKVVQDFLSDQENQEALFGPSARVCRDVSVGTDGNIIIAAYTDPVDGRVTVRSIPFIEIGRTITNPEDRLDAWFMRHDTTIDSINSDGQIVSRMASAWHPTIGDHPRRPKPGYFTGGGIEGWPILWDAPVLHMAENRPDGWKFGVPITYAAVDWALAYKDFLSDWATLMKSLSRIAWRMTGPGRKMATARANIAAAPMLDPATGEALSAGGTATLGPDQKLEAVSKSGATLDANSGDPLVNMIAAAFGFPVTMLLGDPSRGDRSAADNLDRPTELMVQVHQDWWAAGYQRLLLHVIDSSAKAPAGYLRMARVERDHRGRETVVLANNRPKTVRITFPDLDDITPAALVDAIVKANETGLLPPLAVVRRLAMVILDPSQADDVVAAMTGPDGNFKPAPGSQKALDFELQRTAIAAAKAGAAAPAALPSSKGTTQKKTDAENPNDPDPGGTKPAESPTKAKNRAQRAPAREAIADDGTQEPDEA